MNNSGESTKPCKIPHWGWMQKKTEMFWDILFFCFSLWGRRGSFLQYQIPHSQKDKRRCRATQGIDKYNVVLLKSSGNKNCWSHCLSLPNTAFIRVVGSALALLPPMLPLQTESELPGHLCQKKEVNKNKRKSDVGSKTPLRTDDCPLLCPEDFRGDYGAWNGLGYKQTNQKNQFIKDMKQLVDLNNSVCRFQSLPMILFSHVIQGYV